MVAQNIRDASAGADEFSLELLGTAGERLALAHASQQCLHDLQRLGLDRERVRQVLETALRQWRLSEQPATEITYVQAPGEQSSRCSAAWVHSHEKTITIGWVWYDMETGSIGPDDVPMAVRSQLQLETLRDGPVTGASAALVQSLLEWDRAIRKCRAYGRVNASMGQAPGGEVAVGAALPASPPFLERLSEEEGTITLGWIAPGVLYAHFAGVISAKLGQRFAQGFTSLVGDTCAVHFFSDSSEATAYDMEAYTFMVDALRAKGAQLELFINFPWPKLGDRARALPKTIPCLEYVFSLEEFESRLRAAAPTSQVFRGGAPKKVGFLPEESGSVTAASAPQPVPSESSTYTYVFELHDFERGRFTATRFTHLSARPDGAWVCVAHSDQHALALAHQAALSDWAQPSTRAPEDFTVQFRLHQKQSPLDRQR